MRLKTTLQNYFGEWFYFNGMNIEFY